MNEQDVFFYTRREAGRLTGEAEAKATDYLDGGGSAAPRSFSSSRARAASAGPVTAALLLLEPGARRQRGPRHGRGPRGAVGTRVGVEVVVVVVLPRGRAGRRRRGVATVAHAPPPRELHARKHHSNP